MNNVIENVKLNFTPTFELTEGASAGKMMIGGTALVEGKSENNNVYSFKNLEENNEREFKWLFGHPHDNVEEHLIGKGKLTMSEGKLMHEGVIMNTARHPDVLEMVKNGLLGPSIHATAAKIEKKGNEYHVEGLDISGVGLVAFQGVKSASIDYAIAESFKELNDVKESEAKSTDEEPKEETKMEEKEKVETPQEPVEDVKESVSLEEFNNLKKQLEEMRNQSKAKVVESIVALNKDMKTEDLMKESDSKLALVLGYEQKLATKKESVAVVETEVTEKADLFAVSEDGSFGMTAEAYKSFNEEIKERIR